MPRLKLIEMDSLNKMIYFRKDNKLIAFDADVAIELISDSLDGKHAPVRHGHWVYIGGNMYECSVCGKGFADDDNILTGQHEYCGVCGAKMDEPTDTPTDT